MPYFILPPALWLVLLLAGPPASARRLPPSISAPDTLYRWGRVRDERGRPLPGLTVRFRRLRLAVTTDSTGNFLLAVPMRRARRLTHDELLIDGPAGLHREAVALFAPGPIQVHLAAAGFQLRSAECTAEDILGPERAAALRRQARRQRRTAADTAVDARR
ncbi:carboxypeptidase regulatory-like domain-containing protein [Hymenobacter gummosus]|uniref:Carboxypeptidase regulatory-like domain-containing protein n=1 Tax=Hymenobacter gummosus TaxID=1776032 RepID=A0A431TZH4_9BACT|nr:carboxypeptidase-like regulatory domain-containing protein [Hymenobacter gummosus]RTQ47546.1 carboxypeptidase regulatory-like domain-containing protein [Hymenobacter gummosus]